MTGRKEERVRLAVIERSGESSGIPGILSQDMSMLGARYFAVGQREKAVSWMDREIEYARKDPRAGFLVQQFEQKRNHFANAENQPQPGGNPFYGVAPGRWFDRSGYSGPAGVRAVIGVPALQPQPTTTK